MKYPESVFHQTCCVSSVPLHCVPCVPQESFQTLKNWVKELRQHGPPNIVVAIAGNKCDLSDARYKLPGNTPGVGQLYSVPGSQDNQVIDTQIFLPLYLDSPDQCLQVHLGLTNV